jgi:RNA polymerase sigma-70 factor (ECF subfamily)
VRTVHASGETLIDSARLSRELETLHPHCFGWAMACCGRQREVAEDVLHDVYVKVLEGSAQFGGQSTFKTWLFGVIRRHAASHRRRDRFRHMLGLRHAWRIDVPASPTSPGEAVVADDRRERARHALGQLSRRQREVLELVFYHELTIEEAAVILNMSVGSARTHYHRGKVRLAALLSADRP